MALNLGSAAATITLDASSFINNAKAAGDAVGTLQNQTNSVSGNGGFVSWVTANSNALTNWGKGMMAVGGIMTGFLAAPIIAGSKAAWDQVGAVEQATLAMYAYADSTEQVDGVIAGLLEYARSDMGVLFSRQELFSTAQSMLIYGASIEEVNGYTEILSRSVGLGLSDWDSLNTIIGRVGSTGRLTGNDFDMLKARGFDLDESLRNTNITWEELFAHLDKGIPADALAGQADTIRGKTIRLQSALRGLGLAFLGVDADTSKFIEGGLGDTIMKGLQQLTDLLKRAAPAARAFGSTLAVAAQMASRFVDFVIGLPQPVQTAILVITGITGAVLTAAGAFLAFLPVIAAFVTAFGAMGGLSGILGGLGTAATAALGPVRLLGAGVMAIFANPILLAGAIAIGAAILAYKTNFMGFGDMVRDALGWVQDLWAALQLVFGKTHQTTGNFDIVTTADNVWDQWQLQEDGTWKNATLGVTSTADAGTLQYMGLDENTGKWMVMHLSKTGEEIPGEILSSSQSESDPTKFFMEIQLEGGEKITAVYDEVEGTYQILEDPAQMIIETDEAEQNLSNVEKVAGRVEGMATAIGFAWEIANATIAGTVDIVKGIWDALEDLGNGAKDVMNGVVSLVQGIVDAIMVVVDAATAGINTVIDLANKIPGIDIGNIGGEDGGDTAPAEGRTERPASGTNRSQYDIEQSPAGTGDLAGRIAAVATAYKLAAPAVTGFNNAVASTGPTSQQAVIDNNLMASSVLPVGVNMTATGGQIGAAGVSIGSTFTGIAASALTNFTAAQSAASTNMGALASNATAQATAAQASVTSQFSTMSTNSAAKFLGMQAQSAVQLALMAGQATTQGSAVNTNLTKGVTSAVASARSVLAQLSGVVAGAGANAAWAALSAGSNIGNSFAAGMESALGRIQGAANAMVGAAMTAVAAKAMIASPSKVFMRLGSYVGDGFELGIRNSIPDIARASASMVNAGVPSPAFNTPLGGGYGGGTTIINNYESNGYVLKSEEWLAQQDAIAAAPSKAIRIIKDSTELVGGMV